MTKTLPRVVPADPGKPTRAGALTAQRLSRTIAEDPSTWSASLARESTEWYAESAQTWDEKHGEYRQAPLADALTRGGELPAGLCVEVGSGTGLLTPLLAAVWPQVLCLDLSPAMLSRSRAPWRIRADGSALPVADGLAAAVVLADVPLFAEEVVRVLAPGGVVIWSNALGVDAPHHVPLDVVETVLDRTAAGWEAVCAEAGWGLWAVLRRHGRPG